MKGNILNRLSLLAITLLFTITLPAQDDEIKFYINGGVISDDMRENMQNNLNNLFLAFHQAVMSESGKLVFPKKGLTKNAKETLTEMWDSSPFYCDLYEVEEDLIKTPEGYEVRNIPISMLNADEEHQYQELVVNFEPTTGNIENVSLAMESRMYKSIIASSKEVELGRRQVIVNFIENFRTAYNRRDMKYLSQVYSDNALIITGRIVKAKQQSLEQQKSLLGEQVEYVRQSKQEYLTKLGQVFKAIKYLNVNFSDISVVQHSKYPDIYGVTLRQNWTTNNYSDDGYLFLMIDFKDEYNPLIQVRTWQPSSVNGRELTKDEVFHLGQFKINRN